MSFCIQYAIICIIKFDGDLMKTLFITDLDGTFLNNKAEISERSAEIINYLTNKGVLFSLATARTYATVMDMFSGIYLPCPLVLMNGVTIYDPIKNEIIASHPIEQQLGNKIISAFRKNNIEPMLYFQEKDFLEIYYTEITNDYQREYVSQRKTCSTKKFIYTDKPVSIDGRSLVYIVSLDYYEKLKPVYDEISKLKDARCMFYRDTYTDCYFLEIISESVSKATGADEVRKILGVDKIVAFGDNLNDIPLFLSADECYAVENAHHDLKAIATGVIGSNENDAVAEYILNRYNSENENE